jgi:hypothetical protein
MDNLDDPFGAIGRERDLQIANVFVGVRQYSKFHIRLSSFLICLPPFEILRDHPCHIVCCRFMSFAITRAALSTAV